MNSLDKAANALAAALKWLGAAATGAMLIIICLDVAFRALGSPIWGLVETVTLMAVLALAGALPVTQLSRGHVALDMVMRRLPGRWAASIDGVCQTACVVFFALAGWRLWVYAGMLEQAGQVSLSLEFPVHWLVRFISAAFFALCLALSADAAKSLKRAVRS